MFKEHFSINQFVNQQLQRQTQDSVQLLEQEAATIRRELEATTADFHAKQTALEAQQKQVTDRLEGFYGKLIEIFGLFIAIFSFIIAGIQVAVKQAGSFWEQLATSAAVFIPVTVCIAVLLLLIRWTSRR